MTIEDVEKLTGLTAKSIRYYESKNLISIRRNEENSYRDYSEEDVTRLRSIRMFRYLGFSIEEIEKLLPMDTGEIRKALKHKAEVFTEQENLWEEKRKLCLLLAKDYENNDAIVEEYSNTIEFLESDEMSEFKEQVEDFATPNLVSTIARTLIFMAPAFWLFYNIKAARTGILMINGIFAIIGTSLTTWSWIHYVSWHRKNRVRVNRKTRKMAWLIPVLFATFLLTIATVVAVMVISSKWILPNNYLFFEHGSITEKILILILMIPAFLVCILAVTNIRKKPADDMEDVNDLLFLWNHLGKWRAAAIVTWLFALYCCAFSFTAVTKDKIICYTPWQPMGVEYEYTDVDFIKTGFGNKNFSFAEYKRKGNFYYQIEINGHTVTFNQPGANGKIERYEEHTYLELEEFDQALIDLGIPKEGDKTGWENCDFDKEYVDRFMRIIENGTKGE